MSPYPPAFVTWTEALLARHQQDLRFAEVRRGLQALSAQYVARRLHGARAPLEGRGKRAAFAAYYAPMHYVLVAHAARAHKLAVPPRLLDLGCGTGVGAAAWASLATDAATSAEAANAIPAAASALPPAVSPPAPSPTLEGYDLNAWALAEARWNWAQLGLRGRTISGDMGRAPLRDPRDPAGSVGVICAFSLNELSEGVRAALWAKILAAGRAGASVLVVEPIGRAITPWWPEAAKAVVAAGGQALEHKFASTLPAPLQQLARAAGLDHRLLSARSLALAPSAGRL